MSHDDSKKMDDATKARVQSLLEEAAGLLEEARVLTEGFDYHRDYFRFDELGYGAGATLENGEWFPSSQSC